MKMLFVMNPAAGRSGPEGVVDRLRPMAESRGYEVDFVYTDGRRDAELIRRGIERFNPDRLIAGGGDGTIRLVAENLLPYRIPLGILPMGSANGLATALGFAKDPIEVASHLFDSTQVMQTDMLKFNDQHFCIHLSDIGANALLVKKYEESGIRGMMGYAKYLLSSIQESPLLKIKVETPEGVAYKEGYLMAFANAHKYGTGVHISQGVVHDGKFEICNVERITLDSAIKAGLTALNLFVDRNMFSDVISCREAEISVEPKVDFQIDGEYMGTVDHLKIEIVPACVNLLV